MTNRQKDRPKTSHFFVYSRRATHDPHHIWHSDREGPSRFCTPLTFFDPMSSFAARDYWKFEGKCPNRGKMLITWLFVPRKQPNLKLKIHLETRTKSENFVKIGQTNDHWGANLWPKFEILTVLGAVFPHFCPDKCEIWHGGADHRSAPHAKCHACRGNVSPLRGE